MDLRKTVNKAIILLREAPRTPDGKPVPGMLKLRTRRKRTHRLAEKAGQTHAE